MSPKGLFHISNLISLTLAVLGGFSANASQISGHNGPGSLPSRNAGESEFASVKLQTVLIEYDAATKRQRFKVSLQLNRYQLSRVTKVIHDLHPSFGSNQRIVVPRSERALANGFATPVIATYASGWKTSGSTLILNDGSQIAVGGADIVWNPPVSSTEIVFVTDFQVGVEYRPSLRGANVTEFRLTLNGTEDFLRKVDRVVYNVHESLGAEQFANVTTSVEPSANLPSPWYIVPAVGWKTHKTHVYLKSGLVLELPGTLVVTKDPAEM